MSSPDLKPSFSYSIDGKVTHVDSTRVEPTQLFRYLHDLFGSSESRFSLEALTEGRCEIKDEEDIIQGDDPEADAMFLEHIVYDEFCTGDYLTIEKKGPAPQELLPIPES